MTNRTWLCSAIVVTVTMSMLLSCSSMPKSQLLIPEGRLQQEGNLVSVSLDSKPYKARSIADGCGGYWLAVPFRDLADVKEIAVLITKRDARNYAPAEFIDTKRWTSSNRLIDADNPAVVAKAKTLVSGATSTSEKVKRILHFVVTSIAFELYPGMHRDSASATLARGEGICVNHSRLFVALCRAAGVPARTVSGTVRGEDGRYYHHEWAEFYDEQKRWHPLEPTMSESLDFTDLSRIDLVYDIEANPIYPFDKGWEVSMVRLGNRNISVFCTDWAVQCRDGGMSYEIVADNSPVSITARVVYQASRYRP